MNAINLPEPVNHIVTALVDRIYNIKPDFLIGVYLTGSLTMNDFFNNKSDIDFIVLYKKMPDKKILKQLKCIHQTIKKHYTNPPLSGLYLTIDSIKNEEPEKIKTLTYHEGALRFGVFEMAPISLSELKSNGITVFGLNAEALEIEITKDYMSRFLYNNINTYWKEWLKQHSSFFNRKLLLLFFPRLTEWSVLGVARQLYTLQTGKITSKSQAGIYCLNKLPGKFHPIINEALSIRKSKKVIPFLKSYTIKPSFTRMAETIECVNFIINTFNTIYKEEI